MELDNLNSNNNSDEYSSDVSSYSDNSNSEIHNLVGDIINNKYILINKLGNGSFATVWLAYDTINDAFYALKIQNINGYDAGMDEIDFFKKLSKSNCRYLNRMDCNFITKTLDEEEQICMKFPLMAGSIYDVIEYGKYSHGFPYNVVKKIIYQVLLAMNELNNNDIIHTDIKPDNILLEGINKKTYEIIKEFKSFNFQKKFKKRKGKRNKKNHNKIIKSISSNILSKMTTIDYLDYDKISDTEYDTNENKLDNENDIFLDDKYVEYQNISIKLSDFGGCINKKDLHHNIQTRYYRSPEVLLEYDINETCDIWSVGCMIYELLTGNILFDPIKKRRFSRDRYHLYEIQKIIGKIPDYLLEKSQKRKIFYKNNGLLKGTFRSKNQQDNVKNIIKYEPLSELIFKIIDHKNNKIDENDVHLLIDLLYGMFRYDPNKRFNVKDCLNHDWFSSVRIELSNSNNYPKNNKKKFRSNKRKNNIRNKNK